MAISAWMAPLKIAQLTFYLCKSQVSVLPFELFFEIYTPRFLPFVLKFTPQESFRVSIKKDFATVTHFSRISCLSIQRHPLVFSKKRLIGCFGEASVLIGCFGEASVLIGCFGEKNSCCKNLWKFPSKSAWEFFKKSV